MKTVLYKTFHIPERLLIDGVKEEQNGDTIVMCHPKKQYVRCPHCNGVSIGHDRRTARKRHTMVSGKTVWLEITRRRMKCKKCKKLSLEPIEGISKKQSTDHLIQQVQEKARGSDYTRVAKEFGIGIATVSRRIDDLPITEFRIPKKKN